MNATKVDFVRFFIAMIKIVCELKNKSFSIILWVKKIKLNDPERKNDIVYILFAKTK